MRYVIDAHALIWFLEDNPKLSATARPVIDDPGTNSGSPGDRAR